MFKDVFLGLHMYENGYFVICQGVIRKRFKLKPKITRVKLTEFINTSSICQIWPLNSLQTLILTNFIDLPLANYS